MTDDRKNWEEWLAKGPQDYKPARRERSYYAFNVGLMGMIFHLILSAIPQSAWRRFGWQRAFLSIAILLAVGLIAKGVDRWHYGMIERNHYYSWGITEQYQAEYDVGGSIPFFGTFTLPAEKTMYVVPSDALAHQIFSWAATLSFWLAGFGIFLVIWLFWKYPDAFKEGDFRDDRATFGPDLSHHDSEPRTEPRKEYNQSGSSPLPPSASSTAPPTGYTGFGRASGGPKTIEAPRNRSL